jgi:hypothetical protein
VKEDPADNIPVEGNNALIKVRPAPGEPRRGRHFKRKTTTNGARIFFESDPSTITDPKKARRLPLVDPYEHRDVLDGQVGAFGGGVGEPGVVPAQDRCLPAGDGAGQAVELGTLDGLEVVIKGDEPAAGLKGVAGEIGVPRSCSLAR